MSIRALPAPTPRFQVKREAVLGAAARLFNERGVRGATLSDIAASVGLVTNSVTYYYRKKEDLATACFLRAIETHAALVREAANEPSVALRVQALFGRQTQMLGEIANGDRAEIVTFHDVRALPSPQVETVYAAYNDLFRQVRALLKGPETAGLTRAELNARGHIVLSIAHWARSWMARYELEESPRVAARLGDIVVHGIAGPGSTWQAGDGEGGWNLSAADGGARDAFLRAATMLVNEQGYRGASVDRISARLNVTKGSFYHHNDNKDDLISACFDRTFDVVRQALRLAERSPGSGWTRACAAARTLGRWQLSGDGPLLRATAISALPAQAERERVRRTMLRLNERLAGVVVDGMMDGSIRPLDPALAAQATIAAINACAELQRWVPSADADNVGALYVRPLLEGILCPGRPSA